MNMEDILTRFFFSVENNTVTSGLDPLFFGEVSSFDKNMPDDISALLGQFVERSIVLFGNKEDVGGCLRIDVLEGQYLVIFKDNFCGKLFIYDLTENAVFHFSRP